jgi:hypothetical protein
MARRQITSSAKPADWPYEKTHAALKKQSSALGGLRGKSYQEAEYEEKTWVNLTLSVLTHGFGEGSDNVSQLKRAGWAGEHSVFEMHPGVYQSNFNKRIESYKSVLESSIAELELMMPEAEIAGAYEVGDDYAFYKDLKTIVGFAAGELFIIDNYLDTDLFDVYMENVGPAVQVRVLTRQTSLPLEAVAKKFANRGNFELRVSTGVHDRVAFADERCFVIGSSIKDAAVKKPTYIVEHSGGCAMKDIYEKQWAAAICSVKG